MSHVPHPYSSLTGLVSGESSDQGQSKDKRKLGTSCGPRTRNWHPRSKVCDKLRPSLPMGWGAFWDAGPLDSQSILLPVQSWAHSWCSEEVGGCGQLGREAVRVSVSLPSPWSQV